MVNYFSFAIFSSISSLFRVWGKYDVIFVYEPSPITVGIPALVLKKKLKAPVCFWVLDLWPESIEIAGNIKNRKILRIIDEMVYKIYKNCDRIFISCNSFREPIINKNVNPEKIVYYPNWPEDIYIRTDIFIHKYKRLIPEGFKIMFAGNIGDSQDFESIISAASLLRDQNIHWIILGDGRRRTWLEEELKKNHLGSKFHLLGSYPAEEMPHFFYHCDVMLVTLRKSDLFRLTVPAKVQSYLAFGKPIVAMLDGEGSTIIREAGAGLTCNAGNFLQLAENIKFLSTIDKKRLEEMGCNARDYCSKHFNRKSLFLKFEQVVADLQSYGSFTKSV
jgi:glycosyltransferase involved in cell wall biosynthesis